MFDNPWVDRGARALFVGLAVGMAWGIRGDFGGVIGAMYPGAMLGLAFAYVSGQDSVLRRMPVLALCSGLFIGMGGDMSYGILHGYAKADTFQNYSYGLLMLLIQGGCWGIFGGGAIGLVLDDRRPPWWEAMAAGFAVVVAGVCLEAVWEKVLHFQVDSRGNSIIPFAGGAITFVVWLGLRGFVYGLRGAFFGFMGFGSGMFFGRVLSNCSEHLPWTMNNWNVMEVGCGLIGGAVFTWGMVGLSDRNEEEPPPGVSPAAAIGMLYAALGIPLIHLLALAKPGPQKAEWTAKLTEYGYRNAAELADKSYSGLAVIALSGFVVLGVWYWWHSEERLEWGWVPAMGLSLVMLLFHNIHALFPYYPHQPNFLNMHIVLWLMLLLMAGYVGLRRQHEGIDGDDEDHWASLAGWWSAGVAALFVLSLLILGGANGEKTMRSAEMKWPPWSFRQGPPPSR